MTLEDRIRLLTSDERAELSRLLVALEESNRDFCSLIDLAVAILGAIDNSPLMYRFEVESLAVDLLEAF